MEANYLLLYFSSNADASIGKGFSAVVRKLYQQPGTTRAFGHDEFGEIGCDTLINQQDFLGVNLIAIQALEKRTALQQNEINDLKASNTLLEPQIKILMNKRK